MVSILGKIRNGNKEAISDFIVATRQYVLNTARCFVDDDNDAISISKKVYEKIIFDNNIIEGKEITDCLFSLISEEAKQYSSRKIELSDIDVVDTQIANIDVDESKYINYYNDPKVERVLYETINSLPKQEKDIVIRYSFGQESISDIANSYGVSNEVINKYINNANALIEKTSKPLFVKYKIETADYSKVALIYSVVKKCISVVNFDVIGIAADKVKDSISNDDSEEKDLKSFVKDILEDLVQDWFLERIKSLFVTSSIGTVSTVFANTTEEVVKDTVIKGAAKKAGSSIAKKIVIGALTTGVVVTGGVVYKNVNEAKKDVEIVETTIPVINAEMTFASTPISVDFYSSQNNNEVDKLHAEFAIDKDMIKESQLKAIELSASAIGINVSDKESGDSLIIDIIADKEDLGNKAIALASSLNMLSENELDELKKILGFNAEELADYLYEKGYVRLFTD